MKTNLLLYPETFLWFNHQEGILYNCKSKKVMKFDCNDLIYKYCKQLDDPKNLYSVEINGEEYETEKLRSWLDKIEKLKIGSVSSDEKEKRISLPPILNLRNEIEHGESDDSSYTDTIKPSENIHEITLLVGGSYQKNNYYKQIIYPIYSDQYIDFKSLIYLFDNYNLSSVHTFNVVFSDISKYTELDKLLSLLEEFHFAINYYINDFQHSAVLKLLNAINKENSQVNCYFSGVDNLEKITLEGEDKFRDIKWIFLLENECQINLFDTICNKWKLENIEYWPIYTGSNDLFFRSNIYTTLQDIKEMKNTKQTIFCNQVLNSNFWGNLFILPDGMIYYNLNSAPIGKIEDDIIKRISIDILQGSTPWKLIRNNVTPCDECNFRLLCPPPSNYEYSQEKYDMCFKN